VTLVSSIVQCWHANWHQLLVVLYFTGIECVATCTADKNGHEFAASCQLEGPTNGTVTTSTYYMVI